jgi:hypothetical protein
VKALLPFGTLVLLPLILQEFVDWCPWLASRMIRVASQALPPAFRDRYRDEWLAEMEELPGGRLTRLAFAVRVLVTAPRTRGALGGLVLKSVFDVVVSGVLLLVSAPVFAAVALAIRLTSRGPVLLRQVRIGHYDGRSTSTSSGRRVGTPSSRIFG